MKNNNTICNLEDLKSEKVSTTFCKQVSGVHKKKRQRLKLGRFYHITCTTLAVSLRVAYYCPLHARYIMSTRNIIICNMLTWDLRCATPQVFRRVRSDKLISKVSISVEFYWQHAIKKLHTYSKGKMVEGSPADNIKISIFFTIHIYHYFLRERNI